MSPKSAVPVEASSGFLATPFGVAISQFWLCLDCGSVVASSRRPAPITIASGISSSSSSAVTQDAIAGIEFASQAAGSRPKTFTAINAIVTLR